jgi:hypothetical protein
MMPTPITAAPRTRNCAALLENPVGILIVDNGPQPGIRIARKPVLRRATAKAWPHAASIAGSAGEPPGQLAVRRH